MRGLVASLVLVVPFSLFLSVFMTDILVWFGEDVQASQHATAWYRIFCHAMPTHGIGMAIWKFLSAQNVMMPLVVSSVVSIGVVLPVSMHLLVQHFGFYGSAMAYALCQISQVACLLLILCIFKPHCRACWPGFSTSLEPSPLLGAVCTVFASWIRWHCCQ